MGFPFIKKQQLSPLQNEWGVGLAIARVVDMDGMTGVSRELSKGALAAAHALSQTATGSRSSQGERAVVGVTDHKRV